MSAYTTRNGSYLIQSRSDVTVPAVPRRSGSYDQKISTSAIGLFDEVRRDLVRQVMEVHRRLVDSPLREPAQVPLEHRDAVDFDHALRPIACDRTQARTDSGREDDGLADPDVARHDAARSRFGAAVNVDGAPAGFVRTTSTGKPGVLASRQPRS